MTESSNPSRSESRIIQTLSCNTCKTRKRKCNKQRPKCSLCSSKNLTCEYPDSTSSPRQRHARSQSHVPSYPSPITTSTTTPEQLVSRTNVSLPLNSIFLPSPQDVVPEPVPLHAPLVATNFPAVLYLDSKLAQQFQIEIPQPTTFVSPEISRLLGPRSRWETIAANFFKDTHLWMPIVSKKRFYEHLAGVSCDNQLRSDYALIILCMNLMLWVPGASDPRSSAYLAAKHLYLDLELHGVVSIQVLQANVLLTTFEYGHAIFPSAKISLEACVAYGKLLAINWEAERVKKPFDWVDVEEQNRLWWSIVLLDRVLSIGYTRRPFLTAEALGDVNLPSDDHAWDQGIKPFMPQKKVGDPLSLPDQGIGRFALAAETVRILGQVHSHITAETFGDRLHSEEALLLDSTLRALENIVESEGAQHNSSVMNQATMCSISISMLHEAHASRNTEMSPYFKDNHRVHEANVILAEARKHMTDLPRVKPVHACIKETSPFISLPLYHYARANLRLYQEGGSQETWDRWVANKQTLRDFDARWKAAGELLNLHPKMVGSLRELGAYLRILEAREMSSTQD
ncbi:Zn2/Cys6 DNA-binding protein [Glarea lozoyensis ATCC 20868]|uniref:Zn2/Cys6 DNA-binding protein n=1 Tax=Glarea lozoyensis (strain ATCC 20868 / MF5171) TaxID=1116229 RepID=S3DES9_GLAL2|nr:Zn2/Cys6 DNA-binding protein [Glarea lozoyensis ATCC 20868]EPE35619.1 Zn2/Cys6 DNA-binding protein [Glarea lozoyensis ATCC 20868]